MSLAHLSVLSEWQTFTTLFLFLKHHPATVDFFSSTEFPKRKTLQNKHMKSFGGRNAFKYLLGDFPDNHYSMRHSFWNPWGHSFLVVRPRYQVPESGREEALKQVKEEESQCMGNSAAVENIDWHVDWFYEWESFDTE